MKYPNIPFDPSFMEETVFLISKTQNDNAKLIASFYNEREKIYENDLSSDDREKAFRIFYEDYFVKMGLRVIFENICSEFPLFFNSNILIFVKRVWSKKEEESELYTRGNLKTVFVGLQAVRILDRNFLDSFLRREFMHISDILDPNFKYSTNPILGGKSEMEDNFIRDRFRVLWNLYADSRLRRKGFSTITPMESQRREFEKIFKFLSKDEREDLFQQVSNHGRFTQDQLLQFARDEKLTQSLGHGGLCCPLCQFTCYEPIIDWTQDKMLVAKEIIKDHPGWETSMGVCPQCFDIYGSKIKAEIQNK